MKIRNGFVSNSSSSSFLIVGITNVDEIAEALQFPHDEDGNIDYSEWGENINITDAGYGGAELATKRFSSEIPYTFYGSWDEPYYFGIDVEQLLNSGARIPDIKQSFIEKVKEDFGVEFNPKEVNLHYGECEM